MTEQHRNEARTMFERAQEALAAARYTKDGGFLTTAVNRAYYAAFYAARAALLTVGEAPKSHKGVIQRFNLHFVKTGKLSTHVASIFPYAEEVRKGADYDVAISFDSGAVGDLIADVDTFVYTVEPLLRA